jgi:hypothetical protein
MYNQLQSPAPDFECEAFGVAWTDCFLSVIHSFNFQPCFEASSTCLMSAVQNANYLSGLQGALNAAQAFQDNYWFAQAHKS